MVVPDILGLFQSSGDSSTNDTRGPNYRTLVVERLSRVLLQDMLPKRHQISWTKMGKAGLDCCASRLPIPAPVIPPLMQVVGCLDPNRLLPASSSGIDSAIHHMTGPSLNLEFLLLEIMRIVG
jgi:hypothetical protein